MEEIGEENVTTQERVKCSRCGSEIMLKNLKAHEKTKKCQNQGIVVRKTKAESDPAKVVVEKSLLGDAKFKAIPTKAVKFEATGSDSDEDGEEDPLDIVLDDMETLNQKMDEIIQMLKEGFGSLMGQEIDTPKEAPKKSN